MSKILTPRLQYTATAVRPHWSDLPPHVHALVTHHLGGSVQPQPSAGGGFTSGYAAVIRGAHGSQFVKAVDVSDNAVVADCYRREALINQALPESVPAPRIRWVEERDGWLVLGFDAVEGGHMPAAPWQAEELAATLDAYATTAEALAAPSGQLQQVGLQPVGDGGDFDDWRTQASSGPSAIALPGWVPKGKLDELAKLEEAWRQAVAGSAVLHHDLRQDNVLIDARGSAWICDWNWPCLGASWFDLVLLLATAHADGHDATALFQAHPTAVGVDGEQLDAALAALSGFFLASGAHRPADWSPHIRQHQTWCGEVTLRWLADRRGWSL
ncbi:phosphotransferase [Streptomyces globisporus]|uniref:phosphotransferase n=1 Tax=Streptomyces globisporus TaxID=1908 RepID=UPI0004C54C24|nr:phosphotransferase [Streptomyces globisporus]